MSSSSVTRRRGRPNNNNDQRLNDDVLLLDNNSNEKVCGDCDDLYTINGDCQSSFSSWRTKRRRRRRIRPSFLLFCCCIIILLPTVVFVHSKTRPSPSTTTMSTLGEDEVNVDEIVNLTTASPPPIDNSKRKTPRTPTTTTTTTTTTTSSSASPPSSPGGQKLKKSSSTKNKQSVTDDNHKSIEKDFFYWCQQVLGIQTLLRIETFEYYDYFRVHKDELELSDTEYSYGLFGNDDNDASNDDNTYNSNSIPSVEDYPKVQVRGLAATRNIDVGEVVISIPFHAMITVSTTIDHDPVLSRLLGPDARHKFGWDDAYYELPLLTVAVLYHRRLGRASPLYNYIQILNTSPVDTMPSLWDRKTLQQQTTEGVQKIARGIKHDIREMYDTVMSVLIKNYPNVFGNSNVAANSSMKNSDSNAEDSIDDNDYDEWEYSYEKFQWAFALVNSRHWNLPILDVQTSAEEHKHRHAHTVVTSPSASSQVPPAEQPTEDWVHDAEKIESEEDEEGHINTPTADDDDDTNTTAEDEPPRSHDNKSHSFLAPVADLLNFGPPCTRGHYNAETHTFDVKATCSFREGQEVTFWYSDDCEDVIIANYGFTHPMVPKCLSVEQWMERSNKWRSHAESLENKLVIAYEELDRIDIELQRHQALLQDCDCNTDEQQQRAEQETELSSSHEEEKQQPPPHTTLRHGSSNGSEESSSRRPGIRKWQAARHSEEADLGL